MSFTLSADDVRVDEGHILRARLRNANGDLVDSELDLDHVLGNDGGHFQWGGAGFSGSAQDVTFTIEGEAQAPILRARLNDGQGNLVDRDVNLGERIGNNDGQFHFQ